MDLLAKMGDVHIAFVILIHCFIQQPSYFLQSTPPSSTFIESFTSFDFSLQMFGHILGLPSFNNLERPLAHKPVSFPITFGGIELIPMVTIASLAYLKSWVFVASIIVLRFMVDQHPFLLKALARVDNNTFPF